MDELVHQGPLITRLEIGSEGNGTHTTGRR